ncbi:urokinase plasminogen activator surface receptor-like [Brachionichthys hirsutus]|uniref:urokinase plasminogen activator surface receptor-like n=1 Tax=Brachionichthys hirsutus TaxID=412623 RepID=UPI003605142A
MHLLILIFGIVLLPKATTLKCYECVGSESCTGTEKECPSKGFQCAVMRIASYEVGAKVADRHMRSCVGAEQCTEGTVNFGITKTAITSKCCTADLCNIQPAPEPNNPIPNGRKCYNCNGKTCTETLNCEGDEDHCISAIVSAGGENKIMKGCASSQMCPNVSAGDIIPAFEGQVICCQGNFCNSASITRTRLLLLVAPLVSAAILS